MAIFELFVSAGALFDGAFFSLRVSLNNSKEKDFLISVGIEFHIIESHYFKEFWPLITVCINCTTLKVYIIATIAMQLLTVFPEILLKVLNISINNL